MTQTTDNRERGDTVGRTESKVDAGPKIGILLEPEPKVVQGCRSVVVEGHVVEVGQDQCAGVHDGALIRNGVDSWLDGLSLMLYLWPDGGSRVEIEYRSIHAAGLKEAERMTKALRKMTARLRRMEDQFGRPGSAGENFLRAVNAVGIAWVIEHRVSKGWSYQEGQYRFMDLRIGAEWIRQMLGGATEKLAKEMVQSA